MYIEILFYTFIGIFIATAILTLLSLPDWIKISKTHKNILFCKLILEVSACVIILFRQQMLINLKVEPNNEWIAISTNSGEIIRPEIQLTNTTKVLGKSIDDVQERIKSNEYKLVRGDEGDNAFFIMNKNNKYSIGKVTANGFENTYLFNRLGPEGNEIPRSDNYRKIKFTLNHNSDIWEMRGSFRNLPLTIEVKNVPSQSIYQIIDTTGTIIYNSKEESEDVIDKDFRKLHFFEYNNTFYLIRISEADLTTMEKYINFILIELQPKLDLN